MLRPSPVILAMGFCLLAATEVSPAAPEDVSRILKTIDFEERRLGNQEDLPMHWVKILGQGLPHYVNGQMSDDRAHAGNYSFKFQLNGGSLIYRYDPDQVPIRLGAHYRVEAFAQTTVMPHARARITAYFVDLDGHTIPGTIVHSEAYAATEENEPWRKLGVELTASDAASAFLAVQLELVQPSVYAPSNLGNHALFDQDINGSAWFDDVTISQVPRIVLNTDRPGNVFRKSDALQLTVLVSDRFIDDLAAQLEITDAIGNMVYQRSGGLNMAGAVDLGPGKRQLRLDLPLLRPGWYSARLVMTSKNQYVAEQSIHLIRLPDDQISAMPDPRFGIIATDLPFEGWAQLPDILPYLSTGRVKLSVWNHDGDIQQVDSTAFDSLLERLEGKGIIPTACLTALPPSVVRNIGSDDWTQLTKAARDTWQPELAFMVARHANHLDRWQFGADSDAAIFLENPEMHKVYDLLYKEFSGLMDAPDLAMPWPAWYDLQGPLPATVALSVPTNVLPSQLPLYMQDIKKQQGHNLSLSLQYLDNRYGRDVRIADVAQRIVYGLAGGAERIDLPIPFVMQKDAGVISDQPDEMLMIIRTLVSRLGGASYRGRVPIADNIEAFLFDRGGEGTLVLWNRGNDTGMRQLQLSLGDHPQRVDLWGNSSPIVQGSVVPVTSKNGLTLRDTGLALRGGNTAQRTDAKSDTVSLEIGQMPFLLVGVDSATAQLRASVGFDRPLVESSFEPHSRKIHFTNFGVGTIGGSFKLAGPPGWTITPSVFAFTLNPGEQFEREVSIEFPYNSFAGAKTIVADFQVQADHDSHFTVPIALSLGLSDVGMQTTALRDNGDLIVQQMISNYGNHPIDYTAFIAYPGAPRQERLVTQLAPGRTAVKLYRFTSVHFIQNAKVRSGLRETEGTRILNDEVEIH